MSFAEKGHLKDAYNTFQRVCKENGFSAFKVDHHLDPKQRIVPAILSSLRRSAFIIADVSEPRPNVYYELGFAQALGKDIVVTAYERYSIAVRYLRRSDAVLGLPGYAGEETPGRDDSTFPEVWTSHLGDNVESVGVGRRRTTGCNPELSCLTEESTYLLSPVTRQGVLRQSATLLPINRTGELISKGTPRAKFIR